MESAVFLRNSETGEFEILGRISAETELGALTRLGETTGEIRQVTVTGIGPWPAMVGERFAVGLFPANFSNSSRVVTFQLPETLKAYAIFLGSGNLTEGIRLAVRRRADGDKSLLNFGERLGESRLVSVKLWELEVHMAKTLGGGNLSRGVRRALGGS